MGTGPVRLPGGAPRATAKVTMAEWRSSAVRATTGRLQLVKRTACFWNFVRNSSSRVTRSIAPSVFRCVASRNKRAACPRGAKGWSYPNWLDFGGRSQRGRNEHREIAALRRGWLRPARPVGSQEHCPFVSFRQFAASGDATELARVAVRRVGWLRPARLKEPQEQHLLHHPNPSVSACRPPEALRAWATRPATLKGRKSTDQKFNPTLRPFVLGAPSRRYGVALAEDGDSANRAIRSRLKRIATSRNATELAKMQLP